MRYINFRLTYLLTYLQRKLNVAEWLVSAVMSLYQGASTVVKTVYGNGQ